MSNRINLIGNQNSFWIRSLRYLFEDGKPLPQMNTLWFEALGGAARPFGVLTQTDAGRVIFWPPLPKDLATISPGGKKSALDHITLELSNHKSHMTSFDPKGNRKHFRRDWVLHEIGDSGLAQWFSFLVPWAIVEQQDLVVEVKVRAPTQDSERRTDELRKYARTSLQKPISLPEERSGNYVFCVFYLCTQKTFDFSLAQKHFLCGIDENVKGFADGTKFSVGATMLDVGTSRILAATATPPGVAQDDVIFGFPMSKHAKQKIRVSSRKNPIIPN